MEHSNIQPATSPSVWLVLGGSLSAPAFVDVAMSLSNVVVTTNAGWELVVTHAEPNGDTGLIPDYYWVHDPDAVKRYARVVKYLRAQGTRIVSCAGTDAELRGRGIIRGVDTLLPIEPTMSGVACMIFAAIDVPIVEDRIVLLVGHEGYQSYRGEQMVDGWNGDRGGHHGRAQTRDFIAPELRRLVGDYTHIQWVFCGEPTYELPQSPNLFHVRAPHELATCVRTIRERISNL